MDEIRDRTGQWFRQSLVTHRCAPPDLIITPRLADDQMMDFHRASEAIDLEYSAVQRVSADLVAIA